MCATFAAAGPNLLANDPQVLTVMGIAELGDPRPGHWLSLRRPRTPNG
jgi:hypothetical protein